MALKNLNEYLNMVPATQNDLRARWQSSYDEEADVLYIHLPEPASATDSELTDDDIILRYDGEQLVGITVLHASQR